MAYSIGLNSLKKFIPVATALATITSFLAPESAQALIRYSGSPNSSNTFFYFDIDTSVSDSNPNPDAGFFAGAIQSAKYTCPNDLGNVCKGRTEFVFQPGDIIASPITTSTVLNNLSFTNSLSDFVGGVAYEVRLNGTNSSSSDFIKFVILLKPASGFDLLNSLSNLSSSIEMGNILAAVALPNSETDPFIQAGQFISVVDVPEPNATGSLLSAGAIGALLLLKRKKGFTNQEIQNSGLEN